MRVLLATASLGRGGAERAAAEISRVLAESHEVIVYTFHEGNSYEHGGRLVTGGLPYDTSVRLHQKPMRLWRKWRMLRKACEVERPDVVLSFADGPTLVALLVKLLNAGPPVIASVQVAPLRIYKGLQRVVYRGLLGLLYRQADVIVCISSGVAQELARLFGLEGRRIQVIHNPVNVAAIMAQAFSDPEDPMPQSPVVVTVGRLTRQKNQELLIRAFADLRREITSSLLIIGEGELASSLTGLAHHLGVGAAVHLTGWQQNPFAAIKRSDVFVLSSDYEGMGNVLVEAMACECAVVATDCPYGPAEVLSGGKFGVLVPPGDQQELKRAMKQVLEELDMRVEIVKQARRRAEDFDVRVIAGKYEALLAGVARQGETA